MNQRTVDFSVKDVKGRASGQGGMSASLLDQILAQDSVQDAIAYMLNAATDRRRGKVVTEALIAADLADPALREVYREEREEIERYMQHIDIEKLVEVLGPKVADSAANAARQSLSGRDVLSFAIGSGAGLGISELIRTFRSD